MKRTSLALCCALGLLTASASAQLTAYTDQATWEADLTSDGYAPISESFDGITILNMQPGGGPYDVNGDFSIDVTGNMGSDDDAFIDDGAFHGEIFPDSEHVSYVHTFNSPVVGFGQFFDGAATGLGVRISTSEGELDIFDYYGDFDDGFLGFTSATPITSVEIIGSDADGGSAVGEIYDVPDMAYAFVPEPGALSLLALAGVFAVRRR